MTSTLHLRSLSYSNMRSLLRSGGQLPELEFGLLKRYGDKLRWGTAEKSTFLDMATQTLECKIANMTLEVQIRYYCHSKTVTVDYLRFAERFNMKRCLLVLGNMGQSSAPWSELIQPAVQLFGREFNLIWIDIPAFATDTVNWFKYGPQVIRGVLKFLSVNEVHVLACGVGGSLLLHMLSFGPSQFARTHFIYNIDFPGGRKVAPFDIHQLEESLRTNPVQFWFGFVDNEEDENGYNRMEDGSPRKAYEAVTQLQARLAGERRRGTSSVKVGYEEVMITERLNLPPERGGREDRITEAALGRYKCLVASNELAQSLAAFFSHEPTMHQDDLELGLLVDVRARTRAADGEEVQELSALRRLRLGPCPEERTAAASANRRRADLMSTATLALMPGAEASRLRMNTTGKGRGSNSENCLFGLATLSKSESTPEIEARREEYRKAYRAQREAMFFGFGAGRAADLTLRDV